MGEESEKKDRYTHTQRRSRLVHGLLLVQSRRSTVLRGEGKDTLEAKSLSHDDGVRPWNVSRNTGLTLHGVKHLLHKRTLEYSEVIEESEFLIASVLSRVTAKQPYGTVANQEVILQAS